METGVAMHSAEVVDRKRLILSLAGAVAISVVGFGLILLLFAWLSSLAMMWGMMWLNKLPPGRIMLLVPIRIFFLSLLTTTMAMRGMQAIRKKHSNSKQAILPL
jgi:dolichyl-phosphate-mannose--protein O-mannosyl transferase